VQISYLWITGWNIHLFTKSVIYLVQKVFYTLGEGPSSTNFRSKEIPGINYFYGPLHFFPDPNTPSFSRNPNELKGLLKIPF